jgi:hypothetical protein
MYSGEMESLQMKMYQASMGHQKDRFFVDLKEGHVMQDNSYGIIPNEKKLAISVLRNSSLSCNTNLP